MNIRSRIGRRKFDRGVLTVAALSVLALVLTYTQSCTDSPGPTGPAPVVLDNNQTILPQQGAAPPAPPPEENVKGDNPGPSSFQGKDCKGVLSTTATGSDKLIKVRYTEPLNNKVVYFRTTFLIPAGGSINVPSAQAVFEANQNEWLFELPECGTWSEDVQCDFVAGEGEHIGGQFSSVALVDDSEECEECEEDGEFEVVSRELVCEDEVHESPREDSCYVNCELTITRVYTCGRREVRTRPHRKPVDCPPVCDVQTFGFNKLTGDDECEPVCTPPEEITISWEGPGDPATECAAFGNFVPAGDHDPLFYICKAGTDREVWLTPPGDTCRNGRDRSHTTACICGPIIVLN